MCAPLVTVCAARKSRRRRAPTIGCVQTFVASTREGQADWCAAELLAACIDETEYVDTLRASSEGKNGRENLLRLFIRPPSSSTALASAHWLLSEMVLVTFGISRGGGVLLLLCRGP